MNIMNGRNGVIKSEGGESPRRSPSPNRLGADRQKFHRERDRPAPYSKGGKRSNTPPYNRVLVSNIPYEEKWQVLKDLFREKVGEVTYVELFTDESGKSRGYGIVEFRQKELCSKAVEVMNQYDIRGRKLVVKEDFHGDMLQRVLRRDNHNITLDRGQMPPPMPGRNMNMPGLPQANPLGALGRFGDERRGLEPSGPMGDTVFVANLHYKVTYSKLKEVFELAGRVVKVEVLLDKDNKSRGMATVSYEEPSMAAQAISMLNNQKLYDRPMMVRMDKDNANKEKESKLPEGLSGIGPALNMRRGRSHDNGPGMLGGPPINEPLNPGALGILSNSPALAGLTALSHQASQLNEALKHNALPLVGGNALNLASLTGLGDLSRLVAGGNRDIMDQQRLLDEQRARLLSAARNIPPDRERLESRDIARIDNRIRDIDRTLVDAHRGGRMETSLPPMPPPMNSRLGSRPGGTTVFVRNLPYSLTWQKLRDIFSRSGRVMFAEIKTDNGKSRGFGHVRYETPEQADEAVRYFDGVDLDGRKIDVKIDNKV